MNLNGAVWRFIFIHLSFSIMSGLLLSVGAQRLIGCGYLTVEPAPFFLLGSNLTVYCHNTKCQRRSSSRSNMSLQLNGKNVGRWKKVNFTTTAFYLLNVQKPISEVSCRLQIQPRPEIIGGLDLKGGLPPDKPGNIICGTMRSSDLIDCSWDRGRETHLPTTYNISVSRANGTLVLFKQTQDAGEISIPRAMIDEDTKYSMTITAYNDLGASPSNAAVLCMEDILIPETPRITQIHFGNISVAALLEWNTAESSGRLRSFVRLRPRPGSWKAGATTDISERQIQVNGLQPLTEYEFQMKTCVSASGLTHASGVTTRSPTRNRSFCSKWSPSLSGRSPGKGPSQELHVWRMLGSQQTNGSLVVIVLWKPPSAEDYSGEVQQYNIFMGNKQKEEKVCGAALSQCSVQVPAEIQALSISAVTSYGMSSPAHVPLRQSDDSGPVLNKLAPSANGSAVWVSWSWPRNRQWSTAGGELLHYVLEWTRVPEAAMWWKKLPKDENSASVTGLTPGVRYNISLYAVTSRGVSAPSSNLVYSKELEPESGPGVSVLVHRARRIWIQWDELPVKKQRGFITNYTIYLQMLEYRDTEHNVTVSGCDPRQKWLDCPEGPLALQVSASTSAGEGPCGSWISSQPVDPAVGLLIESVFIIAIFIMILVNLMCWRCVRERIKQKCVSLAPAWFDGNLPKPGNSIAIRLLEQDGSELTFSSTHSDPPLSPISLISQEERDIVYPNVHMDTFQVESGRVTVETPLLVERPGTTLVDCQLERCSYKPQIVTFDPEGEEEAETEEEQGDMQTCGEEDRCAFGGLLEDLLSSVELDFSDSPVGLTLSSVSGPSWPDATETGVLNAGVFLVWRGNENDVDVDSRSLDSGQGGIMAADACSAQLTVQTTMTGGYFPRVDPVCSTQR